MNIRTGVPSGTTQATYRSQLMSPKLIYRREGTIKFKFKQVDSMKVFDVDWLLKIRFRYWSNIEELGLTSLVNIHILMYVDLVRRFYGVR